MKHCWLATWPAVVGDAACGWAATASMDMRQRGEAEPGVGPEP